MYWHKLFCIFVVFLSSLVDLGSCESSSISCKNKDVNICSKLEADQCQPEESCDEEEEKFVVCYFTNWAWYRSGRASFTPENIKASLCTHIFYAFSFLDSSTFLMTSSDPWADIDNGFYEKVTNYTKEGVKVLLSIGGWTNSGGTHWSTMMNNDTLRINFVSEAAKFIKKYKFDGMDLNYVYPGCPQVNLTAVNSTDKNMFNQLALELKTALNESLVTASTVGGQDLAEKCYDMKELVKIVDWISIMAYDYHSYSELQTGANAPYGSSSNWSVCDSVKYYREVLECPSNKLVLGIPFLAQTFTMADSTNPGYGVATTGPGDAGNYTASSGTLAFHEVCSLQNLGYTTVYNNVNGSYCYYNTQFVSYDDKVDIIRKSCLINSFCLKGAMIWNLDFDDFNNMCGNGSYPLLKTLNEQLRFNNTTNSNSES